MKKSMLRKVLCLTLSLLFIMGSIIPVIATEQEDVVMSESLSDESQYDSSTEPLDDTALSASHDYRSFLLTEQEQILSGELDVSMRRFASLTVPEGDYYINNLYSGKFLKINGTGATTSLYNENVLGSLTWTISEVGTNLYSLSATEDTQTFRLGVTTIEGTKVLGFYDATFSISQNCIWEMEAAVGGGVMIRNVYSGLVLQYNGTTLDIGAQLDSTDANYSNTVWGMLLTSNYYPLRNFELSDNWVLPGVQKWFDAVPTPSYASWVMPRNFEWSITSHSSSTSFSVTQGGVIVSGSNGGTATLTLTYKLTGYRKIFRITSGAVREGDCWIKNIRTGRYVDIEGPSTGNDVPLQQWQRHTGSWMKWSLTIHENGDYSIQSLYNNKYIHVAGASTASGAGIVQYDGSVNANARWRITATSSGNYRISPLSNLSLALSVPSGQDGDGLNLQQLYYSNNSDYSDEWIFDNVGVTSGIKNGGIYNIIAKHSNKAIDITGGGTTNGTLLNQYPVTPGYQWQRWKFEYQGNGEYKIRDMNSGYLLSISGSSNSNGANSHIWQQDGTDGQIFKIRANHDGTYTFLSKCSAYTKVLDVNDASTANGAIIIQYTDTGAENQKFMLSESVADINFLYEPIDELCQYAEEYKDLNNTTYSENELVLQYIRHNVSDYVKESWPIVAGNIEQGFINYVNNKNGLMNVMFSGHRTCSAGAFLYDADGNEIDFYHMCATLNGLKYNSTIFDSYEALLPEIYIDDLCGWAGDLQQVSIQILKQTNYSDNYYEIYEKALELIGHPDQNFSEFCLSDLLADMDAANINYYSVQISDAIKSYYSQNILKPYRTRFTDFVGFYSKSFLYDQIRIYTEETSVVLVKKWPILKEYTFTENQSDAIAQAFTDFLWERKEME